MPESIHPYALWLKLGHQDSEKSDRCRNCNKLYTEFVEYMGIAKTCQEEKVALDEARQELISTNRYDEQIGSRC